MSAGTFDAWETYALRIDAVAEAEAVSVAGADGGAPVHGTRCRLQVLKWWPAMEAESTFLADLPPLFDSCTCSPARSGGSCCQSLRGQSGTPPSAGLNLVQAVEARGSRVLPSHGRVSLAHSGRSMRARLALPSAEMRTTSDLAEVRPAPQTCRRRSPEPFLSSLQSTVSQRLEGNRTWSLCRQTPNDNL